MNRLHYCLTYYRWIGSYSSLSYETAKRAARGYLPTDFSYLPAEKEKAENVLFWPLVQSGVVRYLGSGQYAYSPALAYRLKGGKYLFVNVGGEPSGEIEGDESPAAQNSLPGLRISDTPPTDDRVPVLPDFCLADYLPLVPPLQRIVTSSWQATTQRFNQVRYRGRWQANSDKTNQDRVQLYRTTEDFGGKEAIRIDDSFYLIPGRTENPEAYPLAVLYADLNTTSVYQPVVINPPACSITINCSVFPTELRKLLFLEHVVTQASFPVSGGPYDFRPDALVFLLKLLTAHP
jgi:hypothetical protein